MLWYGLGLSLVSIVHMGRYKSMGVVRVCRSEAPFGKGQAQT